MQKNDVLWLLLLLLNLTFFELKAQESIPASGGNALGKGGSVSYSIGQVFYTTIGTTGTSLSQGAQQQYQVLTIAGTAKDISINLSCLIYPNPVVSSIILKVEDEADLKNLDARLYNLNGICLSTRRLENIETSIPMESLPSGCYLLKVIDGDKELKIFKIIKN